MKTTGNPKLKIALDLIDKIIESIGIVALLMLFLIPLMYYGELPNSIPSHFDIHGEVDAYSNKSILWLLPMIGLITYIGLAFLNRYPHIFNYPKKITIENAAYQYKMATRFIRSLNTLIIGLFTYLSYSTIQLALGNQSSLRMCISILFVILILSLILVYSFQSYRKK